MLRQNQPIYKIRSVSPYEAQRLADLGRTTFTQAFGADNSPEDFQKYLVEAFSQDIQTSELVEPGSVFFIAESEWEWLGYARVIPATPPDASLGVNPLKLQRMYVLKQFQGLGAGGRLMEACLTLAKQNHHDCVWLSVWERNPPAISFYRKWGFEIEGSLTFIIGSDVQTDHLMVWRNR